MLFLHFSQVQNTLDPLLAALTHEYVDDADLTARLNALFKARRVLEGNITELEEGTCGEMGAHARAGTGYACGY